MTSPYDDPEGKTYALVSHESAVEAIWSLAARGWKGVLWDEDIWLVPAAASCVTTQGDFKQLASEIDLLSFGIYKRPVDLLVPNKSCYSRGKSARFHVWRDFFPPKSFVRVHDRVFVSTPYFATVQLAVAKPASRLSKERAQQSAELSDRLCKEAGLNGSSPTAKDLLAWENIERFVRATQVLCDFMGTYRYVPVCEENETVEWDVVFKTKPIVSRTKLVDYLRQMPASKGIMRTRKVADAAFEGLASPMETMLALVLSLPTNMGGFGLPRPQVNYEIKVGEEDKSISSQNVMYADLCWPDQRLVVEYYGWDEHFGAGKHKVASDANRSNTLSALGWTVLHVTYEQIRTTEGISLLARQIARCVGEALEVPTELEQIWRVRLVSMLLPPLLPKELPTVEI